MECAAATSPRIANVQGSPSAPLGFRFRAPRHYRPRPSPILGNHANDANDAEIERLANDRKFALLIKDEKLKDKKAISQRIKTRVELGMAAYDEDLEARRDRLRDKLVHEEAGLTRELVRLALAQEEQRAAELAARAARAEEEQECQRRALLRCKQLQRYVSTNHELREQSYKHRTCDAKRVNLVQIADAQARRRRELESDGCWHELQEQRRSAEAAEEAVAAARRAELERRTAEEQLAQMRSRARGRAAEKQQPDGWLEVGSDEPDEVRRAKQLEFRQQLDKQLAEARESMEQRRAEEEALDRIEASFGQPNRPEQRERRRAEVLAYMDSLREFRESVARREAQADECTRRWAAEADERKSAERRRAKEEKAKLNCELARSWDQQLEEKRKSFAESKAEESDMPDPVAMERSERAQRWQKAKKYGRELLAQQERIVSSRAQEVRAIEQQVEAFWQEKQREDQVLGRQIAEFGTRLKIPGMP